MIQEEKINISQDALDSLFVWCDSCRIKCGEDGWQPTVAELESTVMSKYRIFAEMRRTDAKCEEAREGQKEIIIFLLWITDTYVGTLNEETQSFIQSFVKKRLNITKRR